MTTLAGVGDGVPPEVIRVLAVALAGLSAALAVTGPRSVLRSRLGILGSSRESTTGRQLGWAVARAARASWRPPLVVRVLAGAAVTVTVGVIVVGPGGAVLAGIAAARALQSRERSQRRRRARQRAADVAEACLALSAEVRAGLPIGPALAAVAAEWPDLFGTAANRAAIGGDVGAAVRQAGADPGAGSLAAVAAGLEVSDRTGASLSQVLVSVADALRMDVAVRCEADSQLATARTTARLLALLPFATLLLLSGGDRTAVDWLTRSPYGLACLAGAGLLVAVGLWWVDRLAGSATRSAWQA